jgi:hypothetical protein
MYKKLEDALPRPFPMLRGARLALAYCKSRRSARQNSRPKCQPEGLYHAGRDCRQEVRAASRVDRHGIIVYISYVEITRTVKHQVNGVGDAPGDGQDRRRTSGA